MGVERSRAITLSLYRVESASIRAMPRTTGRTGGELAVKKTAVLLQKNLNNHLRKQICCKNEGKFFLRTAKNSHSLKKFKSSLKNKLV